MIEIPVTLTLTGGAVSFASPVPLGYTKNKGVYRLLVTAEGEWEGLTIRCFWHLPGGTDPASSLVQDGAVDVPASVTAQPGNGCITFEGSDGVKTVTSADLRYRVGSNSGTEDGTMPEPGTPAWEQLVSETSAALEAVQKQIGNLDDLTTKAKETLVAAINEAVRTGGGAGSITMRTDGGYIQYSTDDGSTWKNLIALAELKGKDGRDGADGAPGQNGADGAPGADGYSPTASVEQSADGAKITITDKNGTTEAVVKNGKDGANGRDGADGQPGRDGTDGAPGRDGVDGQPGKDGKDGITPTIGDNGNWYLGATDTGKPSRGATGDTGQTGATGAQGPAGTNGKSAYQYAVEGGYTGTETEFVAKMAQEIPKTLPNPNALTFTGAVTGSYDGSAAVTVNIPSGGIGGTDISLGLTSAAVGQTVKVKAVDESGKPTAWEAADMPSGGGDTLLYHYDTSEDAIITSTALAPNLDISTASLLLFKWHINGYGTEFGGRLMINNLPITSYFPYIHRKAGETVDIFCVVAVSDVSLTVIKFIVDSGYRTNMADFVYANGGITTPSNVINIPSGGTIESFGIQGATISGSLPTNTGEHLDYTTSGFSVDVYKVG